MLRYRLRKLEGLFQRLQESRRRGRSAPPPRRLQTAQDVLDLLHEQVEALRAAPELGAHEKARAIGYLAGLARRAIETNTLAERLEMLETVLKQRAAEGPR